MKNLGVLIPVSRWYSLDDPGETGRLISLALELRGHPVNGAAGVFASGLDIGIGTFVSIDATLWAG